MSRMTAALVWALLALSVPVARASAQTAEEFYKGRQIRFIVGTAALANKGITVKTQGTWIREADA